MGGSGRVEVPGCAVPRCAVLCRCEPWAALLLKGAWPRVWGELVWIGGRGGAGGVGRQPATQGQPASTKARRLPRPGGTESIAGVMGGRTGVGDASSGVAGLGGAVPG